jgi:predicted nucleic acid-binding protein
MTPDQNGTIASPPGNTDPKKSDQGQRKLLAGILDTSVFIADETGRTLDKDSLPQRGYVSIVTLTELEVGIHTATTAEIRAKRLLTYQAVASVEALAITAQAAHEWARLRFRVGQAGRRININDLWIAATALAHKLPVVTQDHDFDALADLDGPEVIQV